MRFAILAAVVSLLHERHSSSQRGHRPDGRSVGLYHVAPNMGFGYGTAVDRETRCLADYRRQGFERVSD